MNLQSLLNGLRLNVMVICSNQWQKDGKSFNTLQLAINSVGMLKTTIAEELIPDLCDGKQFSVCFKIVSSDGKLSLKPDWSTIDVAQ